MRTTRYARPCAQLGCGPRRRWGAIPHQLSGGQRQRITIARALLLKPKLIIADEPVSMVDASLRATILSTLHALYRDFGISFIYITHDLTTAYQVSENIVILFHGAVAEAGHTEKVIKDPQHPYTRELIHSIPVPEPGREWIDEAVEEKEVVDIEDLEAEEAAAGCRYVLRCPQAMAQCASAPPFYRPEAERAVACFLHAEAPVLESGDLNEVFSAAADAQK